MLKLLVIYYFNFLIFFNNPGFLGGIFVLIVDWNEWLYDPFYLYATLSNKTFRMKILKVLFVECLF